MKTAIWLTLLLLIALPARAEDAAAQAPDARETIEVKRAKHDKLKHESLRFLRDNRAFVREQLDLLRMQVGYEKDGKADALDPRLLRMGEMNAEITAARDTIAVELLQTTSRQMLLSVEELAALEAQLNLFDTLLVQQQTRLLQLEGDFLGKQRTALVVVVRGVPASGAPAALLLQDDDTTIRIPLAAAEITALEQGAAAQIFHEFVEPRVHRMALRVEGMDAVEPAWFELETPRDQMTFLELDLAKFDPADPASMPATQVWQR